MPLLHEGIELYKMFLQILTAEVHTVLTTGGVVGTKTSEYLQCVLTQVKLGTVQSTVHNTMQKSSDPLRIFNKFTNFAFTFHKLLILCVWFIEIKQRHIYSFYL